MILCQLKEENLKGGKCHLFPCDLVQKSKSLLVSALKKIKMNVDLLVLFPVLRRPFLILFQKSRSLGYYKKRVNELNQKLKNTKLNDSTVLSYLSTKFNAELYEFVSMQLKNCGRSKHGRRYTAKQKSLCLAMYKQGPRAYRFNEGWSCLPTKRTLGRFSAKMIFKAGFDSKSLEGIKSIVKDWPQQNKYCSFGWDEVSLNEHLDYCKAMDIIEGFVEVGQAPVFATHALTFMVRGIAIPFKQSVGYFYTNGLKSFELVELNKLMIQQVLTTGNINHSKLVKV